MCTGILGYYINECGWMCEWMDRWMDGWMIGFLNLNNQYVHVWSSRLQDWVTLLYSGLPSTSLCIYVTPSYQNSELSTRFIHFCYIYLYTILPSNPYHFSQCIYLFHFSACALYGENVVILILLR